MLEKSPHRQTRNRYRILHTADRLGVKTAILRLCGSAHQRKYQQFLLFPYLMPTRPTVCSSCCRQMSTSHHIDWLVAPFFEPDLYNFWNCFIFSAAINGRSTPPVFALLTYVCNHCPDTPVTLAIPAKGIFSSSNLSIKSLVSCSITFFIGFWTNCLPQSLHLKFWLPLWINPFLTIQLDSQRGQVSGISDMTKSSKTSLLSLLI